MMLLVVFVLLVISMTTVSRWESEGSNIFGRDASCPASERIKVGRPSVLKVWNWIWKFGISSFEPAAVTVTIRFLHMQLLLHDVYHFKP